MREKTLLFTQGYWVLVFTSYAANNTGW